MIADKRIENQISKTFNACVTNEMTFDQLLGHAAVADMLLAQADKNPEVFIEAARQYKIWNVQHDLDLMRLTEIYKNQNPDQYIPVAKYLQGLAIDICRQAQAKAGCNLFRGKLCMRLAEYAFKAKTAGMISPHEATGYMNNAVSAFVPVMMTASSLVDFYKLSLIAAFRDSGQKK